MHVNVIHVVPPALVPLIKLSIISTVLMKAVEKPHHKKKINIINDYLNISMQSPQFCHRPKKRGGKVHLYIYIYICKNMYLNSARTESCQKTSEDYEYILWWCLLYGKKCLIEEKSHF